MRVRTIGLALSALGILIGAGGCSSDSPTSPLAPSAASASKGKIKPDTAVYTTSSGGYLGAGTRTEEPAAPAAVDGGYLGAGT